MKLNRYMAGLLKSNEGDMCWSEDVARLEASHKQLLEVLKELQECSVYWSDTMMYSVSLGIHDRIKNAIKAAEDIE